MPATAHVPDLIGQENRSFASQCIKTKKKNQIKLKNKIKKSVYSDKKNDNNNTKQTKL